MRKRFASVYADLRSQYCIEDKCSNNSGFLCFYGQSWGENEREFVSVKTFDSPEFH